MKLDGKLHGEADAAFVALVLTSRGRLRRVAYLMCGDWHRAEDIVQTALTQVYIHWERIQRNDRPEAYARRAVINAAIDEGRRPCRREKTVDQLPEIAAAVEHHDITTTMASAICALPVRQRAVIVLRYVEDLDVEQTAALLGISSGTVKSQASRALVAMRERLTECPVNSGKADHRD